MQAVVSVLVFAALLGCLFWGIFALSGDDNASGDLTVKSVTFEVTDSDLIALGELTNQGSSDLNCVSLIAEARDSSGVLVDVLTQGQIPRVVPGGATVGFKLQGPAAIASTESLALEVRTLSASHCR